MNCKQYLVTKQWTIAVVFRRGFPDQLHRGIPKHREMNVLRRGAWNWNQKSSTIISLSWQSPQTIQWTTTTVQIKKLKVF